MCDEIHLGGIFFRRAVNRDEDALLVGNDVGVGQDAVFSDQETRTDAAAETTGIPRRFVVRILRGDLDPQHRAVERGGAVLGAESGGQKCDEGKDKCGRLAEHVGGTLGGGREMAKEKSAGDWDPVECRKAETASFHMLDFSARHWHPSRNACWGGSLQKCLSSYDTGPQSAALLGCLPKDQRRP